MNKFRKLGLIDYNGRIHVHVSLLNAVLHDHPTIKAETDIKSEAEADEDEKRE